MELSLGADLLIDDVIIVEIKFYDCFNCFCRFLLFTCTTLACCIETMDNPVLQNAIK